MLMDVKVVMLGQPEHDWLPSEESDRKVNIYGMIYNCETHGPEPVRVIERLDDVRAGEARWLLTSMHGDEWLHALPSLIGSAINQHQHIIFPVLG